MFERFFYPCSFSCHCEEDVSPTKQSRCFKAWSLHSVPCASKSSVFYERGNLVIGFCGIPKSEIATGTRRVCSCDDRGGVRDCHVARFTPLLAVTEWRPLRTPFLFPVSNEIFLHQNYEKTCFISL